MKTYLVVEGPADVIIGTRLLPPALQQHAVIVPVGGRGNVTSVARTLLVTRRKPLAVLVDADTLNEAAVGQLRWDIEDLLRALAAGLPCKVLVAVPEIEVILFRAP